MRHARDPLRDVFGPPPDGAAVHRPAQGDLAVGHADLDVGGVHVGVVGEAVVDVLPDALIPTLVGPRTAPPVVHPPASLGLLVTEPGGDLVTRALEEAAPLAAVIVTPVAAPAVQEPGVITAAFRAAVALAAGLAPVLAAMAAAAALLLLPAAVPLLVFSPPPLVVRHRNQLLLQRDKRRHERRSALHHLFRIQGCSR